MPSGNKNTGMATFFATAEEFAAWAFFKAQPPSYRQLVIWRIVSAKRAETRERRSADLIKASQELRRLSSYLRLRH
jgi:Bacteriocin-protection, YdeI or OmpD-Associated